MIENLATSCCEILGERRVDGRQFLIETVKFTVDIFFRVGEQTCGRGIYKLIDHTRQHPIETGEEIRKREVVLFQRSRVLRFDDCKTLPVQYRRRGPFQDPVHFAVLGKVCDLRTTAKVTDSREKKILDHGAEHYT